jgi:hypothetical protein
LTPCGGSFTLGHVRVGALIRKPSLTRRLPQLRWRQGDEWPIVSATQRAEFPEFEADFGVLDAVLVPAYRRFDGEALEAQNRSRLFQLLLISGGATATVLGIVQAALGGGAAVLGIAEAVLAGLLASLAVAQGGKAHRHFLNSRLKAERLRSEYFVFLTRAAEYAELNAEERRALLRRTVIEVEDLETG